MMRFYDVLSLLLNTIGAKGYERKQMEIREIENHKFIKLIEYALKNESFTVTQVCEAVGMSPSEFNSAKYSIFQLKGEHENIRSSDLNLPWQVSTKAFFDYLSFLQYRDAVKSAKKAHCTAVIAIIITGFLALGSIIVSLYT